MKNDFYPCQLIEHADSFSIVLSDFYLFDDYLGNKGGGGYAIERLAKKILKENNISEGIRFDSEAGMFCAYSENKELLQNLCILLRKLTGEEEYSTKLNSKPKISLDKAEKLLLNGFVIDINKEKQAEFLQQVPYPILTGKQTELINAIRFGSNEEKIFASKRINSEARTTTRKWDNYLSHPQTITYFLEAIDSINDNKVLQELIWALVFICDRHLPDLRVTPYFIKALENKNATIRWLGIMGMGKLYKCPEELIIKAINDKSQKVREEAEYVLESGRMKTKEFPSWLFEKKNY